MQPRKPRPTYPRKVSELSSAPARAATDCMSDSKKRYLAEHRAKYRAKINQATGSEQWPRWIK